jgi:hypothetical protein
MPKDEFDFDDPLELNGVGMLSAEDTTDAMTECLVEEFMRLGYNAKQILAMFRNPHYLGMNMALERRGEQFVRDTIAEGFARRGKTVTWASSDPKPLTPALSPSDGERENRRQSVGETCTLGTSRREQKLFPLPLGAGEGQGEGAARTPATREQVVELDSYVTDPLGIAVPKLNS